MASKWKQKIKTTIKPITKIIITIIIAICGALLEASTDLIKNHFEPALVSTRNFFEDKLSPIPESAVIGLNITFYIPSATIGEKLADGFSATIPGSLCTSPNGHSIVHSFHGSYDEYQNNMIIHITCRPSGRILISLSPQSGHEVKVYEGRFNDGDKVPFPGIPGSYHAGILTMHRLDAVKAEGEWEPVNTCLPPACKDFDFSLDE